MNEIKIKKFSLEKNLFSKEIYLNISFEFLDRLFHGDIFLDFKELGIEKEILNFDNLYKKDFIELDKIILDYLEKNLLIERWENGILEQFDKYHTGKFYKILWNVYYSDFLFSNNYFFYKTDLVRKTLRISPEKVSCNYFIVYFDKPNFIEKIYFEGKEIIGADKETFEILDDNYSKDKNNVYYGNEKIEGADPKTFEKVEYHLLFNFLKDFSKNEIYEFKDKNNFYNKGKFIKKSFLQKIFGFSRG